MNGCLVVGVSVGNRKDARRPAMETGERPLRFKTSGPGIADADPIRTD